ncbi:mannose-1-phosphate guanyltransferase, partial [Penicillium capsulatum]
VHIEFSVGSKPLGIASPLRLAEKILGKDSSPFFVLNSDIIYDYPFKELAKLHKGHSNKEISPPSIGSSSLSRTTLYISTINTGIYILNLSVSSIYILRRSGRRLLPAIHKDSQLHSFDLEGF